MARRALEPARFVAPKLPASGLSRVVEISIALHPRWTIVVLPGADSARNLKKTSALAISELHCPIT
jgi:hypothetical protein